MDEIWTIDQLAEYLHFSRAQVYTLTRERSQRGKNPIPVLRVNSNIRFRKQDIIVWLDRLAKEGR